MTVGELRQMLCKCDDEWTVTATPGTLVFIAKGRRDSVGELNTLTGVLELGDRSEILPTKTQPEASIDADIDAQPE